MFNLCSNLIEIKGINNFITNNVIDMSYMFCRCYSLTSLDLSNFNTNNAIDISYMFRGCLNLRFLNLNQFKLNEKCKMDNLFKDIKNNICDLITNDKKIKNAFLI